MKKYEIIFMMCDGDFMIDVGSGYMIDAQNEKDALEIASKIEDEVSNNTSDIYYDSSEKTLKFISFSSKFSCENKMNDRIVKCMILKKGSSPEWEVKSQKEFCKGIDIEYVDYLKNREWLTFESVAYGVVEVI